MLTPIQKIKRNFSDMNYARAARRAFDDKPLQCSLYVTDQCNLDCAYCTEYDNSVPHPPLEDLERWARKIRDLGTMRIALVGGEPLTHPDIVELTRYCKEIGLSTSMTTNGFLLTPELVRQLEEAGLDVMQISIDRITPSKVTRKSLKTVTRKIDLLRESTIKLHITGVICADTLDECEQVLDYGLERDIPTEIRLVHADPNQMMRVDPGERERLKGIIRRMIERKERGEKVHTNRVILDYQMGLLDGRDMKAEWTCAAGFKLFFVSARGKFMECSMRPTTRDIMDMTVADLKAYHRKKDCQTGCGVYCAVSTSMFRDNPVRFVAGEVGPRLKQTFGELRPAAEPVHV